MAEANGYEEHANNIYAPPSVPVVPPDIIDLTESDDYQKDSVSTNGHNPISSENCDESFTIVYENIKSQLQMQIVDLANDVVGQAIKLTNNQYNNQVGQYFPGHSRFQVYKKVRVGIKSLSICISINKSEKGQSNLSSRKKSPKIRQFESSTAGRTKPPGTSKIECGICFDPTEEIIGSNRKVLATLCGHIFCCVCLKESMKSSQLCPKCRKKLSRKRVHLLYV